MAFNYSPKITRDSLSLYLDCSNTKSYTSGSTTWKNLISSNVSGSVVNYNGPITFTYVDTNPTSIRIQQPSNSSANLSVIPFSFSENYSIELWYKTLTTGSGIVSQGESPGIIQIGDYAQNASLTLWDWSAGAQNNHILRTYVNNGSIWSHVTGSNLYSDANWVNKYHQIVLNFSGTSNKWNKYDLYVDTNFIYSINFSTPFPSSSIAGGNNLVIPGAAGGSANNSYGMVRCYSKTLTSTEILQNYNATKSRFNLT